MKLLKIGRDATCDIVLHSDKVSSLHAEITLLNSGDIMIEDKGSRNGTFIMNQPIKPGKPVSIRRGDAIRFADVELQWSQIPMPEDNSAYKGIYGIGSHFNNDIQVSGATVSRYHATVKNGRDGKMYIVDHSKNGTTVDGVRIPSNQPYRIKRNSSVVCGGVPVDLSRLPWPKSVWANIAKIAAAVVLLLAVGYGIWKITPPKERTYNDSELYAMYNNSIVYLEVASHYEVSAGNLDEEVLQAAGIPTKFKWYNGEIVSVDTKIVNCGTGFFVSNEGQIVTNLHVVKPWLSDDIITTIENYCKAQFAQFASSYDIKTFIQTEGEQTTPLSAYTSQIKVKGVLDRIVMVPQGKYYSAENAEFCRLLSAGNDLNEDVALLQTEKGMLPLNARFINVTDSINTDEKTLTVGSHMYTLGFPAGTNLQDESSEKGLQVLAHGGSITQADTEYSFGFDAASYHGASGSPIFNEHGMLIGILNQGVDAAQGFNYGIKAKYIDKILKEPHKISE